MSVDDSKQTVAAAKPPWIFASLRGLQLSGLPNELTVGLMLATVAIPQQLAYAHLAGMPTQTGLYAFLAGAFAFAIFGANRILTVAADSTITPILAGGVSAFAAVGTPEYTNMVSLLALLVGLTLLATGIMRAGWIADLISVPVETGFLAGIAIHIIIDQLPNLLGLPVESGHLFVRLHHVLDRLASTNLYDLAISAGVLATMLGAKRVSGKIPGALIGIGIATLAVWAFGLERNGVHVLGALPSGIPWPSLPSTSVGDVVALLPLVVTVTLVCVMKTAAAVRAFDSDATNSGEVGKDFGAVGAGSVASGLLGSFAVNASLSLTAVITSAGGVTQIGAMAAGVLVACFLFFASDALLYVPDAALSAVLVVVAIALFRVGDMIKIYRYGRYEILIVAACMALVLSTRIDIGVLLSILLSLLHSIYILARPQSGSHGSHLGHRCVGAGWPSGNRGV